MPPTLVIRLRATPIDSQAISRRHAQLRFFSESIMFRFQTRSPFQQSIGFRGRRMACVWLLLCWAPVAWAAPVLGPWIPLFKGIDHARGTNIADASNPDLNVINVARIDLQDPDVSFLATPRIASGYVEGSRETGGMTVSRFLQVHKAQLAINANFFDQSQYYLPEGTPMDLSGLAISGGEVVSKQDSAANSAVLTLDAANHPTIIHTNWPAKSTAGIQTAVAGVYPVVINGVNIGRQYLNLPGNLHDSQPRTLMGLSADRRYLYLMTIDGRQPGYSDGALDSESGAWMLKVGAVDAINMDGGGSTTLVMENSLGNPTRLNKSSAVADSGKERTVGSHLAVFAKPVPSYISGVQVVADDEAASVTWKTSEAAISWIEYGPTTDLGSATPMPATGTTAHAALLPALTAGTPYYYRVVANAASGTQTTDLLTFTTINYNAFQSYLDLTNSWKYSTAAQSTGDWTKPGYGDSSWGGPAPAVLWVDVRAAGPNELVQPKATQLPADPANGGYPYITYYFRTHFQVTDAASSPTLQCDGFIDDGAVFYLNGTEVYRLRVDPAETVTSSTLATGYPCSGDATCSDSFTIDGTALVNGDNVLAVEVHNYNAHSADMTFGVAVSGVRSAPPAPQITLTANGATLQFDWTRGGFTLQQADAPIGPWTDVSGPVVSSPFIVSAGASARFYRLNR